MLRTRLLSAIVMIPLVIGLLLLGGWWFWVFVGLVLSAAAWEYGQMARKGGYSLWLPVTLALVWLPLVDLVLPAVELLVPGLVLALMASLVWTMVRFTRGEAMPTTAWAITILGGLYLGILGMHFIRLRALDGGLQWSAVALGSTWLADSGAYSIGRQWGKHKLSPKLSPGKTWEGSVGGLIVGLLATGLLAALFDLQIWHGVVLGVLIAVLSPLGDLGVSMIKRQVGVKDSGTLVPGHGGAFDRIDSLLVSVTIAFFFVTWVVQ